MEKQQQIDYSSELQQLRNSLDSLHIDIDKQSKVTADKLSNLKLENKTKIKSREAINSNVDISKDKPDLSKKIITFILFVMATLLISIV